MTSSSLRSVAIILPCLNEAENIEQSFRNLSLLDPKPSEIIVVDGGSDDGTLSKIDHCFGKTAPIPSKLIQTTRADRGHQLNVGAAASTSDIVSFLHIDSEPPSDLVAHLQRTFKRKDIAICGIQSSYRIGKRQGHIFTLLNLLKTYLIPMVFFPNLFFKQGFRLLFGDQLISCPRSVWRDVDGFPEGGLMEDADFCRRVARNRIGKGKLILSTVTKTSGRRCENLGFWSCCITYFNLTFRWAFRRPLDRWVEGYYKS